MPKISAAGLASVQKTYFGVYFCWEYDWKEFCFKIWKMLPLHGNITK